MMNKEKIEWGSIVLLVVLLVVTVMIMAQTRWQLGVCEYAVQEFKIMHEDALVALGRCSQKGVSKILTGDADAHRNQDE